MKVLVTHELFMPVSHGGGEKVVFEIAKNLQRNGIEIEVATTGDPKIKKYRSITTHRLPVNRYLMNFASGWIKRHAKRFDLIQTNNYNACYASWRAAKSLKKPVVCLVHGMYGKKWLKMRGPIFGYISYLVEKFQINRDYDKIIFLSEYARDEALKLGVPKRITEVIKPGVPRNFKSYKIAKKETFVLFVGRLSKQKGLETLIEAAKELPNIEFILVGEGEEEGRLKKIAPPNVRFLGYVSDKKLIELYSKALILCLPSIGEGFGLVLLEAMASGCAIISTVPLDFYGKHIPIRNSRKLRGAIRYLVNNQQKARIMGRKNRRLAMGYTWEKFTKRLIEIYKSLVSI